MTKTKKGISNFLSYVEKTFMPIISRLGSNRYLEAIRNGMVSIIPILLIGSTFLIIFFFPIGKSATFGMTYLVGTKWGPLIMLPYRLTYPVMGLFALIGITRSLAKHYKLEELQAVFIGIIAYLISVIGPTINWADPKAAYFGIGNPSNPLSSFGSSTIFGGIFIAFASVEIYRLCIKYKVTIRLPKSVPPVVAKPFAALIPLLLVIIPSMLLFYLAKFDIHQYAAFILSPLQQLLAGNNYFGFLIVVLFVMVLWIAGIHGMSVVGALARPFWLVALDGNAAVAGQEGGLINGMLFAKTEGVSIIVEPFFQWFVWIGGAGATLGLIIVMLLFARSKYIRAVSYPSIVPGIFNINEPIIFGYPIVLNPFLAIPAILSPIVMGTIAFIFMKLNVVPVPVQLVGWTLPSPVGALLSTNMSVAALLLSLALIVVSALIWLPFAIAYDKKLLKEEIENEVQVKIEEAKKANLEYDEIAIRQDIEKELYGRGLIGKISRRRLAKKQAQEQANQNN